MSEQINFKQVAQDAVRRGCGERRHRFGTLAVTVAIVLALAGCNSAAGGESPGEPSSSSDSSQPATSPTPTPTSTAYVQASAQGPAQNVPVPEKPALASEMTKEGWEAFMVYFFDEMNYLVETNDFKAVQSYTTASCQFCLDEVSVANGMEQYGQWRVGGKYTIESVIIDGVPNQDGYFPGIIQFTRAEATPYDEQGPLIIRPGAASAPWSVVLGQGNDGWVVISITELE